MLEWITDYVATLNPVWFYLALALSSFVENVVPPVPGDTVTVFAAYLVGRSDRSFAGVLLSTTVGSTFGFMALYAVGRSIQRDYFIRRDFRFLPVSSFLAAERWFQRFGYWVILTNRFFSGIRSVISIMCGLYRLPWPWVFTLSFLGCAVWNLMLIWAGYLLGANWALVEGILAQYSRILLAAAVILLGLWVLRRRRRTAPSGAGVGGGGDADRDSHGP